MKIIKKDGKLKICPKEMKKGMEVEKEHNDITHGKEELVRKIVMAHLKEDKHYYSKLEKMEEK